MTESMHNFTLWNLLLHAVQENFTPLFPNLYKIKNACVSIYVYVCIFKACKISAETL